MGMGSIKMALQPIKLGTLFLSIMMVIGASASDPVTSHVLDTSSGHPASGLTITLSRSEGGAWTRLQQTTTDEDGRAADLVPGQLLAAGVYKLHFATGAYYSARGEETFYPYAEVVFNVTDPEAHYHVPLLINPFGYTTYRGS